LSGQNKKERCRSTNDNRAIDRAVSISINRPVGFRGYRGNFDGGDGGILAEIVFRPSAER